ncbi:RNA polymerase sigma factor sigB-like isoform X1 [Rhododendron vialii]|uniref:RNA polymerase sigma factor sigB-like isoform X1 n=1 Tax=Rhododendron vialii TaxID=182163 RepID=UPI00265FB2EF|nr:RNA polymerase sigma factor sigB-like isoform X1 [Rhododendron vialii]
MSHLPPQFKCVPDTFSFHSKSHLHSPTLLSTKRWHIYFRMPCILSRTSPHTSTTTTVLDMEKLQLTSLEAHSNLADADIPCTCVGAIGSATETTFGAVLAKETLLTGEEAITHATAAEAVSLAKAAANVSEDSRMMFGHYSSSKLDGRPAIIPSEPDTTQLAEIGVVGVEVGSTLAKNGLGENCYPSKEADDLEQILNGVAVRSRSQTEQKGRREKVAQKAAAKDTCVKSVFTTPKGRATLLQGDDYNPLGVLVGVTSRSRFLTRAEEHNLSEGVKDLLKIEKLREELDDGATFAEWAAAAGIDEKTLSCRLAHGIRCKEKIIRSFLGLVGSIAKTYHRPGRDLGELVWAGCQGIIRTTKRFDPTKGRFATYATWWIKLEIRKCVRDQSSSSRLPVHLVESLRKVKAARNRFYSKTGRSPSKAQVAKETRLSMKSLQFLLLVPRERISMDQKWLNDTYQGGSSPLYRDWDSEEEEDPLDDCSPEEAVRRRELKRELEKELDTLTPREKQVIKCRFGMDSGRSMTLQAIGDIMDVSRERVRQIEESALKKLKEKNRGNEDLELYLTDQKNQIY